VRVVKSKNIRIQMTLLATFALIFSVALCYFLGWDFEIKSFIIAICVLLALVIALWLLCIFLIKYEKKYYDINNEHITLWQNNELLCELKKVDIINMQYVRFRWALLMQMGSGYLNITCPVEALTNKSYASLIMPNGTAIFEISVSKKQAKQIAKLIGIEIVIK